MSNFPLFSKEIDISKVSLSDLKTIGNKHYFNILYDSGSLILQTPIFKFINEVTTSRLNGKIYNDLFLFLTPNDNSTYDFITLFSNLEQRICYLLENGHNIRSKNIVFSSFIKSYETESSENKDKHTIRYIKTKLLDITKIDYNGNSIDIDALNELLNRVDIKMLFEINSIWLSNDNHIKINIFIKPIKIRAIDIVNDINVEFRDDDLDVFNDFCQTEHPDIFRNQITTNSILSINDSTFKQLNTFIPSTGYDNNINVTVQNQLKTKLLSPKESKSSRSSKSLKSSEDIYQHNIQNIQNNRRAQDDGISDLSDTSMNPQSHLRRSVSVQPQVQQVQVQEPLNDFGRVKKSKKPVPETEIKKSRGRPKKKKETDESDSISLELNL
jgi:hypothetical protein